MGLDAVFEWGGMTTLLGTFILFRKHQQHAASRENRNQQYLGIVIAVEIVRSFFCKNLLHAFLNAIHNTMGVGIHSIACLRQR